MCLLTSWRVRVGNYQMVNDPRSEVKCNLLTAMNNWDAMPVPIACHWHTSLEHNIWWPKRSKTHIYGSLHNHTSQTEPSHCYQKIYAKQELLNSRLTPYVWSSMLFYQLPCSERDLWKKKKNVQSTSHLTQLQSKLQSNSYHMALCSP